MEIKEDKLLIENAINDFLVDGGTLAMLKSISVDDLEQIYLLAYNLYQSEKHEDAQSLFQLLCILDHYDARFFLGLGACRQAMGLYSQALETYSYASLISVSDPRFPFHAAECLLKMNEFKSAEQGFITAKLLAGTNSVYENLVSRTNLMLEAINLRLELRDELNH